MRSGVGKVGLLALGLALTATPTVAFETSAFAGVDISASKAWGSSSTIDGGAPFAGGATVNDIAFGTGLGIGGHIGYRLNPEMSVHASYLHLRSGVSWTADYALVGVDDSHFQGTAVSHVLMGNGVLDHALSDATTVSLRGGLGLALNTLSGVDETHEPTGLFLARLAERTTISPAAELGVGLSHKISPSVALTLESSATYIGDFSTGDTRVGNLGVTEIGPYGIERVWHGRIGASLSVDF